MRYMKWTSKSNVTSSFWGIWNATFFFSLSLSIGKRSTLAKISALPRFLWAYVHSFVVVLDIPLQRVSQEIKTDDVLFELEN